MILAGEDGGLLIVVSSMAIAETLKADGATPEEDQKIIDAFFDQKYVAQVTAGGKIGRLSADLRRAHDLAGMDAVHVATAVWSRTPILLTNDGQAKRKKQPLLPLDKKIMGRDGQPLRIMTPQDYHAMQVAAAHPLFRSPSASSPPDSLQT